MKKIYTAIFTAVFFFLALTAFAVPCAAWELNDTADLNRLVTSNYKDAFMTIETSGDRVTVSGVFKNDTVKEVYFPAADASDYHLSGESDGTFAADITVKPLENGYYPLFIKFESRLIYSYMLKYNGGWSVPDNGIAKANAEKLKNIDEPPPIAAAYYLSVEADRAETEETLAELRKIVDQVCGDETDDYVKAMKLIFWIGDNIYYDHVAAEVSVTMDTVAVHNVLERRRTTCAGFANTYSALLEIAGIRSVNLKGAAVAGEITYPELTTGKENHEFSAFWYEKERRWVYCDPCWTSNCHYRDGVYQPDINNGTKYFDVTGEAYALNHRIDKVEERFYTRALAAIDDELAETETETETEAESSAEKITEESAGETKTPDEKNTASAPSVTTAENRSDSGENVNITPYIILGLAGVMVIGAGIILAVQKNKK